ncbi:FAD/NAD-P-binding domain-containing protein [Lactifluus subvellereus]|nr:FAD/NAD-P-binding domain-containing protein [Lactifluus subvellereus]
MNVCAYRDHVIQAVKQCDLFDLLNPRPLLHLVLNLLYISIQLIVIAIFKPKPPKRDRLKKPYGRIAVVGAGLTGISSAAHCVAHNFEVVIYDANDTVGGIWANVNKSSSLQLNSLLYRFHPGVLWSRGYPYRDEILSETRRIWKEYKLESRTRLGTRVTSVRRAEGSSSPGAKWIVNDGPDGKFDAIIVTIGTCGEPRMVSFPGMPKRDKGRGGGEKGKKQDDNAQEQTFCGAVIHSSKLDDADLDSQVVVVIGSGASGVEAVETALSRGAWHTIWIIPRNVFLDTLISAQPFGRQMPASSLWEKLVIFLHYRDIEALIPKIGIYESTPVVNDEFLQHVRAGRCTYIHADVQRLTKDGILVRRKDSPGIDEEITADVVVLATGFKKASMEFLPKDLFPENYERPNLYLQNFSTEDWSVLCTNSAYLNAIGTHIGIYTRILLLFLLDESARPQLGDVELWVDAERFIKRGARRGVLSFFTYVELVIWVTVFHVFKLDRLRWAFFTMQGWGVGVEE